MNLIDFDLTELESFAVWSGRPRPPVDSRAGLHAHESGVRTLAGSPGAGGFKYVSPGAQTYVGALRESGYATAQAGKFARGFERLGAEAFEHFRPFQNLKYFGLSLCQGWPKGCRPNQVSKHLIESQAIAAELEAWLEAAKAASPRRPFYAEADFYAPHDPWGSTVPDRAYFTGAHFAEPESLYHTWGGPGACARVAAAAKVAKHDHIGLLDYKLGPTPTYQCRGCTVSVAAQRLSRAKLRAMGKAPGDDAARRNATYQAAATVYARSVVALDRAVGRLLDAVEDRRDDTVVIFASDQGVFLGEHGRVDKRLAYDEAMAFPLLVRYPPAVAPGVAVDALAANFDLGPTILELARAAFPAAYAARLPGESLAPALRAAGGAGAPPEGRAAHYYRFFEHHEAVPGHVAVRVAGLKLVYWYAHACGHRQKDDLAARPPRAPRPRSSWNETVVPHVDGAWELFDLARDPAEVANVWAAPAYRRRRCAALVELLVAKDAARDDDELTCPEAVKRGTALGRAAASKGATVAALCAG